MVGNDDYDDKTKRGHRANFIMMMMTMMMFLQLKYEAPKPFQVVNVDLVVDSNSLDPKVVDNQNNVTREFDRSSNLTI